MLPVINIGPLALPAPQLILLVGFWIGLELTERLAPYFQVDAGKIYNLVLVALLAGLAGARIGYALDSPAAFLESPLNLLALRPDMLDAPSGCLAAGLAGLLYAWRKGFLNWAMLDALASLFAVLGIVLGLAHLASGDAFGAPARLPWSIELWGEQRHPSQVYEILAALLVAALTWPGGRVAALSRQAGRQGLRLWGFLALSAAARLFLEAFRGDSVLLWGAFRQAQAAAWVVLAFSLWQVGRRVRLHLPEPAREENPAHVAGG